MRYRYIEYIRWIIQSTKRSQMPKINEKQWNFVFFVHALTQEEALLRIDHYYETCESNFIQTRRQKLSLNSVIRHILAEFKLSKFARNKGFLAGAVFWFLNRQGKISKFCDNMDHNHSEIKFHGSVMSGTCQTKNRFGGVSHICISKHSCIIRLNS